MSFYTQGMLVITAFFLVSVWAKTLINIVDANGRRVLAYYYYGIKHDIEKSRRYVEEGMSVIEKYGLPGAERELERKLLMELDEMITANILRS